MNLKKAVVSLLLNIAIGFLPSTGQAQQWQTTKLDDSTTVDFPVPAQKRVVKGQETYFVNDEQAIYITVVQKGAYDENPEETQLTEFYDGVLKGTLEGYGGGKVTNKKVINVDGFIGLEAQLVIPPKPDFPAENYLRIVLVKGTLFTQNFMTSTELDQQVAAERHRFFGSFRPGVSKAPYAKPGTNSQAYKLGKLLGSLIFYGALLGGIIALIRRLSKPKKEVNI